MRELLLHGIGRFGQHLLHAWLVSPGDFDVRYMVDGNLTASDVCTLLNNHDRLDFGSAEVACKDDRLYITTAAGSRREILFFNGEVADSPFSGMPDYWLECSGLFTDAQACRTFLRGRTSRVLISATSWNADRTLVYGFNHPELEAGDRVISYGSCTVNAFVPLAGWIHRNWGVAEAEVNVIHNLPEYKLRRSPHPRRHHCTLQDMAPKLLSWLQPGNIQVNYYTIPYTGASMIDFRFRLFQNVRDADFISDFTAACQTGPLKGLYRLDSVDGGVEAALGLDENAGFFKGGIGIKNSVLRMAGYFDNENSAMRYYDLLSHIADTVD